MYPHPSFTSTSALASVSSATQSTLATRGTASSTHYEKASDEREVIVNNVTGPAAGLVTDRSTLPRLTFSLKGLINDHEGLYFLLAMPVELLSQLTSFYVSVPQERRIIRGESAKLTNKLVSLSLSTNGQC